MRVLGAQQRLRRRRGVLIVQIRHPPEPVEPLQPHAHRIGVERLHHAPARRRHPQRQRCPPRHPHVPERRHRRLAQIARHLLQPRQHVACPARCPVIHRDPPLGIAGDPRVLHPVQPQMPHLRRRAPARRRADIRLLVVPRVADPRRGAADESADRLPLAQQRPAGVIVVLILGDELQGAELVAAPVRHQRQASRRVVRVLDLLDAVDGIGGRAADGGRHRRRIAGDERPAAPPIAAPDLDRGEAAEVVVAVAEDHAAGVLALGDLALEGVAERDVRILDRIGDADLRRDPQLADQGVAGRHHVAIGIDDLGAIADERHLIGIDRARDIGALDGEAGDAAILVFVLGGPNHVRVRVLGVLDLALEAAAGRVLVLRDALGRVHDVRLVALLVIDVDPERRLGRDALALHAGPEPIRIVRVRRCRGAGPLTRRRREPGLLGPELGGGDQPLLHVVPAHGARANGVAEGELVVGVIDDARPHPDVHGVAVAVVLVIGPRQLVAIRGSRPPAAARQHRQRRGDPPHAVQLRDLDRLPRLLAVHPLPALAAVGELRVIRRLPGPPGPLHVVRPPLGHRAVGAVERLGDGGGFEGERVERGRIRNLVLSARRRFVQRRIRRRRVERAGAERDDQPRPICVIKICEGGGEPLRRAWVPLRI